MTLSRALYATNVYHYDHVLLAMQQVFAETGLVRRFELTIGQLEKLKKAGVPSSLIKPLARRVREPAFGSYRTYSLGPSQMVLPLLARSGAAIKPWHIRAVTANYARKAAKVAAEYDYFHFSEGLGFKALESKKFNFSICERRNFHHAVYEKEIEVFGDFPANGVPDPIGHILDYEYENSDSIMVYSKAAHSSFIERGFEEAKMKIAPIGIGPQLPRVEMQRSNTQLLYVGRGDAYKGLDVAVAAVKLLGPRYRLTVAGVMPPTVARWLRSQTMVDYVGVLDREALRRVYSTSAAMILPSIESFGLAAAEAVYHGLPLICSDKTGIAEYLPAGSKFVLPGRDPAAWAAVSADVLGRSEELKHSDWKTEVDDAFARLSWNSAAQRLQGYYSMAARAGG